MLAAAVLAIAPAGCGGNVVTRLSTVWVDIRPDPTPLQAARTACREEAASPGAAAEAMAFCMRRHGWVAMSEPLLE